MMTPDQKEVCDLYHSGHSFAEISRLLGVPRTTVRDRYHSAVLLDGGTRDAMQATNGGHIPRRYWAKTKNPDGTSYSVLYEVPQVPGEDDLIERLKDAFSTIPAAPLIPKPRKVLSDRMTVYPWFDVHFGMKARKEISGEDYDMEIATKRVISGLADLMAEAPNSYRGVIINGGDFTHADDDLNVTPVHKHVLDVDGRNYTTVDGAVELISAGIEMALQKHAVVEYYSVPGNHDPKNWVLIMFALAERYRLNPRVKIERNPLEYSIITHGETIIVIHHGHKRDVKEIVMWFAAEYAAEWAAAKYRLLLTGHNHKSKSEDFPGMRWEQMSAITARDHYAASAPYSSLSEMLAITFTPRGERGRIRVDL